MVDEIEPVDAAELAALERVADLTPHDYAGNGSGLCAVCNLSLAAKWHVKPAAFEQAATLVGQQAEATFDRLENDANRTLLREPVRPASPEPLRSFVDATAVDERLARLEAELAHQKGMVWHTMLLVMILADRQRVSADEYDKAKALAQQAEPKGPR